MLKSQCCCQHKPTLFVLGLLQRFSWHCKNSHVLMLWALTLKPAHLSFRMTFRPMIMYRYAKFGYQRFSSSESAIRTNIKFWTFALIMTLNTAVQSFHKTLRLMGSMYHRAKVVCKRVNSSKNRVKTAIFWLYEPSLRRPWRHRRQHTNICAWHPGLWWYNTIHLFTEG